MGGAQLAAVSRPTRRLLLPAKTGDHPSSRHSSHVPEEPRGLEPCLLRRQADIVEQNGADLRPLFPLPADEDLPEPACDHACRDERTLIPTRRSAMRGACKGAAIAHDYLHWL